MTDERAAVSLPLTVGQASLLFLQRTQPSSPFYTIPIALQMEGTVDPRALARAVEAVGQRHDALRTRFPGGSGTPSQLVRGTGLTADDVRITDLRHLSVADAVERRDALLRQEAVTSLDLEDGGPLRAHVIRVTDDSTVLSLLVHHIVLDGPATAVVLADLAAAYEAETSQQGRSAINSWTPAGDYGAAVRALAAQSTDSHDDAVWWRAFISAAQRPTLPHDREIVGDRTYDGDVVTRWLPAALAADVDSAASTAHISAAAVGLTAFAGALTDWTGSSTNVVGLPVSLVDQLGGNPPVGYWVNTLPIPLFHDPSEATERSLERVWDRLVDVQEHRLTPLLDVVRAVAPERTAGAQPLFDVTFQMLASTTTGVRFRGAETTLLPGQRRTSQFEVSVDVTRRPDGLLVQAEYSVELFDRPTIDRLLDAFAGHLRRLCAPPASADGGSDRLATTRRATVTAPPQDNVAGLVRHWARERPDEHALSHASGRTLTYAELWASAVGVAQTLAPAGPGTGPSRAGLWCDDSLEATVLMLGMCVAGVAWVPLSPDWPTARLKEVAEDASLDVVLAASAVARDLGGLEVRTVADDASDVAAVYGRTARMDSYDCATDEYDLYVMYTSGSTGRPKGVRVSHSNVLDLACRVAREYGLVEGDVALQLAPLWVDVAVEEAFGTWAVGGHVHVERRLSPETLNAVISRWNVAVVNLPVHLWSEWCSLLKGQQASVNGSLRAVVVGSDVVSPRALAAWYELSGPLPAIFNGYGTTEATVTSCSARLKPADAAGTEASVPIARRGNDRVLVLVDGRLARPGETGEIYIVGPGVSRGYLNDPKTTAARFPATSHGAAFATGDRAFVDADGDVHFLGRDDLQVKVGGFRVDLAEVERHLREVPGVAEAVAGVIEDRGRRRLHAWVTVDRDGDTPLGDRSLGSARVAAWRDVHGLVDTDPVMHYPDFRGWNDTLTGAPFPADEMQAWLDATARHIGSLDGASVLEVGCGNGLVLGRVAPLAETYVGTDISLASLRGAHTVAAVLGVDDRVELHECEAGDVEDALDGRTFDVVVVNSVVQYFPSLRHLEDVLDSIWRLVAPGGRLFVGDVRDLGRLRDLHTALLKSSGRAPADATVDEAVAADEELCLSPAAFGGIANRWQATACWRDRTGAGPAELADYRYDVTLTKPARGVAEAPTTFQGDRRDASSSNDPLRRDRELATSAAVTEHLTDVLPAPMVPAATTVADDFPRLSSGKVDRRALRPQGTAGPRRAEATTDTERVVADVVGRVLGRPVGVDDDFFRSGGDSLDWLRVVAQARDAGVELPIAAVYRNKTPRALAAAVDSRAASVTASVPTGPLPLTPLQNWLLDRFPDSWTEHAQTSTFVVPSMSSEDLASLVERLPRRHPVLRSVVEETGRTFTVAGSGATALEVATDATPPANASRSALARGRLDPTRGINVSVVAVPGPHGWELTVSVHHLFVDALSWQAISATLAGPALALGGDESEFLARAAWLAQGAGAPSEEEEVYWADARTTDPEPADFGTYDDAHRLMVDLGPASRGATSLPLLACVAHALLTAAGTADARPPLWFESSGRRDVAGPQVTDGVGWFTGLYPLGLSDADRTASAVLRRLAAVPADGSGFMRSAVGGASGGPGGGYCLTVLPPVGATTGGRDADDGVPGRARMPFALEAVVEPGDGTTNARAHLVVSAADRSAADAGRLGAHLAVEVGRALADAATPDAETDTSVLSPGQVSCAVGGEPASSVEAVLPLTDAQEAMLTHHLLAGRDDGLSVVTRLDVPTAAGENVRAVVSDIVRAHPALRTSFRWSGLPEPVQVAWRRPDAPLRVLDWTGMHADRVEARLTHLVATEQAKGVDLEAVPPWRATAVVHRGGVTVVWVDHHLLLDGWSGDSLFRELATRLADRPSRVPDIFDAGMAGYLTAFRARDVESARDYWAGLSKSLAHAAGGHAFPLVRRPGSNLEATSFATVERQLDDRVLRRVERRATDVGVTPSTIYIAAWGAALADRSSSETVALGIVHHGRLTGAETDTHLGTFSRVLPLCLSPSGSDDARSYLADVARAVADLDAVAARTGVEDVARWAALPPASQLLDNAIAVQSYADGGARDGKISAGSRAGVNLPVGLSVSSAVSRAALTYRTDRLDQQAASALLDDYARYLDRYAATQVGLPVLVAPMQRPAAADASAPAAADDEDGVGPEALSLWREAFGSAAADTATSSLGMMRLRKALRTRVGVTVAVDTVFGLSRPSDLERLLAGGGTAACDTTASAPRSLSAVERAARGRDASARRRRPGRAPKRRESVPASPMRWLAAPRDARVAILAIPHAGGGSQTYRPWLEHLPPDVALLTPVLPGRETELSSTHPESLSDLADSVFEALDRETLPPLGVFGHSMGGYLALEVAGRLESAGRPPHGVTVSGVLGPDLRLHPGSYTTQLFAAMDDEELVEYLRTLGGLPAEVAAKPELMQVMLPTVRRDLVLSETHRRSESPPSRTLRLQVVQGADDPATLVEYAYDWSLVTSQPVLRTVLPGDHFYWTRHVAAVVDLVLRALR